MGDVMNHACVLLSGGMDSVAALHWARERAQGKVRAVAFDYGQPNRDHELTAGHAICAELGIPYARLALADTLNTGAGLLRSIHDHDPAAMGVHRAFVPGRNAVFLTVAAAHACTWWVSGRVDLVVGACADDHDGFPDCRENFFAALERAICRGYGRDVRVNAPFVKTSKADILAQASEAARADLARSWSCYRREGPCGTCTPCVLRAGAFAAAGVEDRTARAVMCGGDPVREKR
jgi:7-cyano-7-deazaguanine synthase